MNIYTIEDLCFKYHVQSLIGTQRKGKKEFWGILGQRSPSVFCKAKGMQILLGSKFFPV